MFRSRRLGAAYVEGLAAGSLVLVVGAVFWCAASTSDAPAPSEASVDPILPLETTPQPVTPPKPKHAEYFKPLRELHDGKVASFVKAPDFGESRMLLPTHSYDSMDLRTLHRTNVRDFVSRPGNGVRRVGPPDFVIGYPIVTLEAAPETDLAGHVAGTRRSENWELCRHELIGVLLHDTPVVYMNEDRKAPMMDVRGKDHPSRELSDFEKQSLESLRGGEDLVFERSDNVIRLVGSLRATADCKSCHRVDDGALLGAFTYQLVRGKTPVLVPRK